jgi:hypothetical protein
MYRGTEHIWGGEPRCYSRGAGLDLGELRWDAGGFARVFRGASSAAGCSSRALAAVEASCSAAPGGLRAPIRAAMAKFLRAFRCWRALSFRLARVERHTCFVKS